MVLNYNICVASYVITGSHEARLTYNRPDANELLHFILQAEQLIHSWYLYKSDHEEPSWQVHDYSLVPKK